MHARHQTYGQRIWKQYCKRLLGVIALIVVLLFVLVGIYAPFLASSKPMMIQFDGSWYFPLFRYLFYPGFFTKRLDIFYNLLMFTFPIFIFTWVILKNKPLIRRWALGGELVVHCLLFVFLISFPIRNPAVHLQNSSQRQQTLNLQMRNLRNSPLLTPPTLLSWKTDLSYLTPYAKLNLILRYYQYKKQKKRFEKYEKPYSLQTKNRGQSSPFFPSLWNLTYQQEITQEVAKRSILAESKARYLHDKFLVLFLQQSCQTVQNPSIGSLPPWLTCEYLSKLSNHDYNALFQAKNHVDQYEKVEAELQYMKDRQQWLQKNESQIGFMLMPLIRPFHWEDDAGGDQGLNHIINWWDLTRINRKDMVAALIFGTRISLSVGLLAIGLALLIGVPIGAFSGYYGGKLDLIVYRLIEIWESMPTFFMLLMVIAFLQSKSIFLVIAIIGLFGWTNFSRFTRGEFLRQKQLLYVEACHALGYGDLRIIFSHLLPNAIPPLLTLVPFAIMGAITSEAGLSFLGLGEEGSNSWGVLMDEGRSAFPAESYLLWPPAILLTILLVAIALVGDSSRDALDPKLHS